MKPTAHLVLPALALGPFLFAAAGCDRSPPPQVVIEQEPSVDALVTTVLDGGGTFRDVEFAQLIETSTGNRVLPFNPTDPVDAEILAGLERALDAVLERFNRPDSPTSSEGRINEVSAYFEDALMAELDQAPEFACGHPRTAEGHLQHMGYPDIELRHLESGRVVYIDPKLVGKGSLDSSLRTFYFTPRRETNKVLHDAHHLLVGIVHDENTGNWKFLRWKIVDLTRFQVTLKAEFQADNKDIYRPELVVKEGEAAVGE